MTSIHSEQYRDVIRRLIKARKEAGFTQEQVADMLKKPQSFMSKIENFQRRLDILELQQFAELYKADISRIINE